MAHNKKPTNVRSSVTGRYVKHEKAKTDPQRTESEARKPRKKK